MIWDHREIYRGKNYLSTRVGVNPSPAMVLRGVEVGETRWVGGNPNTRLVSASNLQLEVKINEQDHYNQFALDAFIFILIFGAIFFGNYDAMKLVSRKG